MADKIKACWWCVHFYYSQADYGYSEYTPGSEFSISCNKSVWDFDPHSDTQDDFGTKLQSAETCPAFEVKK